MDSYASLLGFSDATVDTLNVDTIIVNKDLTVFGDSTLTTPIFPTGASLHKVLTCNDILGTAVWQDPADAVLSGDCTGFGASNQVNTLAGGTIAVSTLATLAGTQTLTNKTLGLTNVRAATFGLNLFPSVDNAEINIGFNTTTTGSTGVGWAMGQGPYSCGAGNFGIGVNNGKGLLMKLEASTGQMYLAYQAVMPSLKITTGAGLGKVLTSDASGIASWLAPAAITSVGDLTVTGMETLQKSLWLNNQLNTKMINLGCWNCD